jgi:hypothetical protein
MDVEHILPERLAKIEAVTSDEDTHEGYSALCLFIRLMNKGAHFLRIEGDGAPHHTHLKLANGNQSVGYTSCGANVELHFDHLVSVLDLSHKDKVRGHENSLSPLFLSERADGVDK